ncbi:MAG: chemotaxis protein CheA, partial [Deltaproteobacteria bacterium]|nr:chemotaxis protein CheA [Deltaproteobacteria bacterium]
APEEAVPEEAAPEEAAAEEAAAEEAAPEEAAAEEAAAEEAAPEEAAPEETVPEEMAPEEAAPEEAAPEEAVTEEAVTEEAVTEETAPEETAPEETAPEEAVPEEAAPEEAAPEEAAPEEAVTEEATPEEAAPEEAAPEETGTEETVAEEAVSEEAVSEEAVSEEAVSEEAAPEEAAAEEAVTEEAVSEETAPKEAVSEEADLEIQQEAIHSDEERKDFFVPSDVHSLDSLEELDVSDDVTIERLNIPGIGKVKTKALEDAGFTTVGTLRRTTKEALVKVKGINELTAELILAEVTPFVSHDEFAMGSSPPFEPIEIISSEPFHEQKETSFDDPPVDSEVQASPGSQFMPPLPSAAEKAPLPAGDSEPLRQDTLLNKKQIAEPDHERGENEKEKTRENKERITETAREEEAPLTKSFTDNKKQPSRGKSIDEIILTPQISAASKQTVRVETEKVDNLIAGIGELVVNQSTFGQISNNFREVERLLKDTGRIEKQEIKYLREARMTLDQAVLELGRTVDELQGDVMRVRMVPVNDIFNKFPRLVRDLSKEMGKNIKVHISGGETELDKNVTEEIYNPLVHLLRNAMDHGIESPEVRKKSGKSPEGHIELSAHHEGDKVIINIRDDGQGINTEQIKKIAIEKGVISKLDAAALTMREITNLIFHPGFSTTDKVTDISGRGVGMDVVKKNVDKLRGTIEIESEPGQYTQFSVVLPLTLAIIQALLVRVGDEAYCIPITSVIETERTRGNEIETIENTEVIRLRDKVIPLLRLSDIFNIEEKNKEENPQFFAVIVTDGVKESGIVVDSLIGESSIVIKPFEEAYMETDGISGATILGDGRVSLILDVPALIQYALERKRTARVTRKQSKRT